MFYFLLFIFITSVLFTFYHYGKFKKLIKKYFEISSYSLSGYELARNILDKRGLFHVKIELAKQETIVQGNTVFVTTPNNAYFSEERKLTLTDEVYYGKSIAALTIASHEVSHAIQHEENFFPILLQIKCYYYLKISILIGFLMIILNFIFQDPIVYFFVLFIYLVVIVYHLFTIYIEYNANKRAFSYLSEIVEETDIIYSKKMMKSAFLGYVFSTPFIIFIL